MSGTELLDLVLVTAFHLESAALQPRYWRPTDIECMGVCEESSMKRSWLASHWSASMSATETLFKRRASERSPASVMR